MAVRSHTLPPGRSFPGTGGHDLHGLVGEIVAGRFRVLSLQRAGPRGVVYEAEPPGVGLTRRALKLLTLAEAREPEAFLRLRAAIDARRAAADPCLEAVHHLGRLPDETPFIEAEWLPWSSLADALAPDSPPGDAVAQEILRRVAGALAALHRHGLTHGDLRAEHVLCELTGEANAVLGGVKVIDAGLAGALGGAPGGGTPAGHAWIAPERIVGRGPSPAADVYALGVLAYQLLSGRLPFRAEDPRADDAGLDPVARVRWLHLNAAPVRPSVLRRNLGRAAVPPAVEGVVARALAKAPASRFADAGAFLEALESALRDPDQAIGAWPETPVPEPSAAREPPSQPIAAEPSPPPDVPARRPLGWWALAGAAFGAAAGWLLA